MNLPLWAQFALVWLSGLLTAAALLAWLFRGAITALDRTMATREPVAGTFGPFGSWAAKRCNCGKPECRLVHVAVNGTPGSRMTMPTDEQAAAAGQAMMLAAEAKAICDVLGLLLDRLQVAEGVSKESAAFGWIYALRVSGVKAAGVVDFVDGRFVVSR